MIRPFGSGQPVRIEDYTSTAPTLSRAEVPGLDPGKDVEVTVGGGVLPIHAGHPEKHEEARRSEFRYGSLPDSVVLPGGANPDKITASYDSGILEVKVQDKEPRVQSPG